MQINNNSTIRGYAKNRRVEIDGHYLDPKPSQEVHNHSPDGFNFGYSGSGPSQLALAIMLVVTGDRHKALELYQDFKFAFIAKLPQHEDWEITIREIRGWINEWELARQREEEQRDKMREMGYGSE